MYTQTHKDNGSHYRTDGALRCTINYYILSTRNAQSHAVHAPKTREAMYSDTDSLVFYAMQILQQSFVKWDLGIGSVTLYTHNEGFRGCY